MCCYKLWFVSGLSLFQCVGSNVIVFPWLTPNNTIWFSSDFCHLNHASNWHSAISISLAKKQRHSYYTACLVGNGHCFAFKLCYVLSINFGLFIILKQTTNYANSTKKTSPFSRFQMVFFLSSLSVCCALCVFLINQVKLQAMHHSVSSVRRKWMVTWSFTQGFCILFPLRTATMGEQMRRSEQQRKIWFRVSSEKFICDINIWYLKHDCSCVHQDKVTFKFSQDVPLSLDDE